MASTRLPGKVMIDVGGGTMLSRVVTRVRRARTIDRVVVATTTRPLDDVIVEHVRALDVDVFRGDEDDVLGRYQAAAAVFGADVVVRITSDCPLIDPGILDHVMTRFLGERVDFVSNTLRRTYPFGLDIEVISRDALECAAREASAAYERTHVTPYLFEHPDRFRLINVSGGVDYSWMHWTVDEAVDVTFTREVYGGLGKDVAVSWLDVLALLKRKPQLSETNRYVRRKTIYDG